MIHTANESYCKVLSYSLVYMQRVVSESTVIFISRGEKKKKKKNFENKKKAHIRVCHLHFHQHLDSF